LHYLAIWEKNKKIYLLSMQAVSDFARQKNPEFSHQTCKFVLIMEGPLFLAVLSGDYFVVLAWPHVLDVQRHASGRRQANALYSPETPRQK